jgi:hypothetical protein
VKGLVLAALAAVLVPAAAHAESPRVGSFELMAGPYRPAIDKEPGLTRPAFRDVFGKNRPWLLRVGVSYDVTHYFGSLEVGLQTGYLTKSGFAQTTLGTASSDETTFRMIPTSATLTYRFDYLADRYNVPLAPYGRVAFDRYNWWITGPSGGTSKYGATNGWSAAFGLALMLDFFDPTLAREMDRESGINHTYVFAEARKTKVNDFGSSRSWDLSDDGKLAYSFGMLFVF